MIGNIRNTLLFVLLVAGAYAQKPDTTLTIKAVAGLQYDLPRFAVRPGMRVTLNIDNYDDMAHNLVLTRPGARQRVVTAALNLGDQATKLHYVPRSPDVLAYTLEIEPGKSETIAFTAPDQQGVYPYVCTFPGHGFVMYGAMYVTRNPQSLPPLDKDPNVAANRKEGTARHEGHQASDHPYELKLPAHYRTFMPDCGPAAIAVGLPPAAGPGQSYCWDAGTCRLRYAWSGGFVDMSEQWEAKGMKLTHPVGDIYYRDSGGFPFRINNQPPQNVQFLGYRLVNRYPEFHYSVDGFDIRESIKPAAKGRGLVRQFRLNGPVKPVSFLCKSGDGARWIPSAGTIKNGLLNLPSGTKSFTITLLAE